MNLSIRHWIAEQHIESPRLVGEAQIAGVAFRIIQDMEGKSLSPLDISTLTEILELPLGFVWQEIGVIAQLTRHLLRNFSQKKPLKRNEGTWLAFQIAYLQALQQVLEQEFCLKRPWLDRAIVPIGLEADQGRHKELGRRRISLPDAQLQGLLKTLRSGKLSDTQAEQALSSGVNSFLVQQINTLVGAWFVANGAEELEAKLLIQRLGHGLPGHLLSVIALDAVPLVQLQKFVHLGSFANPSFPPQSGKYNLMSESELLGTSETPDNSATPLIINLPMESYRANLIQALSEPLFEESFALKDLYISPKGIPLENNGDSQALPSPQGGSAKPVDLMEWITAQLTDLESIILIEAESGYGKTSFCQIWTAQVAQELYPNWMPVFIQLRNVTLGKTLEQTLDSALSDGQFTSPSSWFLPPYPPVVLLLDGLDELPRLSQNRNTLDTFLDQVMRFHSQHVGTTGKPRHKIVLTSRPWQKLGYQRPTLAHSRFLSQFRRIAIQPLGQDDFKQWFQQWSQVQSKGSALAYFNFLKQRGVFFRRTEVQELASLIRQPLMLYLLGVLHRDGRLDNSILQMASFSKKVGGSAPLLLEIYDRLLRWLLGEPTVGGTVPVFLQEGLAHVHRTPEVIANLLQGRTSLELRHQMQTTTLNLLQSQRHSLTPSNTAPVPTFFFKSLNPKSQVPSPLQFSHPKLGEYLCAEAIAAQLKSLVQLLPNRYGEFTFRLDSPELAAQHLYNLLGYGILTTEIEELVLERLRREQAGQAEVFSFQVLLERLNSFYRTYCSGRWLDENVAHKALLHFQTLHNPLNVLQVDAAVGLNTFLLLCACHKEVLIPFYPCGNPANPEEFNPEALLLLIGRTTVLSPVAFGIELRTRSLTSLNLVGVRLNQTMLAGANLKQTNLSKAELIGVNLAIANLQEANLSGANLSGANLSGANLSGANLEGANLTGANLRSSNLKNTNLTNSCLFQAQLDEAQESIASKSGALFSLEEFQAYQEPNPIISEFYSDEDEAPTQFVIESAEGEPLVTMGSEIESEDEETAFLENPTSNGD